MRALLPAAGVLLLEDLVDLVSASWSSSVLQDVKMPPHLLVVRLHATSLLGVRIRLVVDEQLVPL